MKSALLLLFAFLQAPLATASPTPADPLLALARERSQLTTHKYLDSSEQLKSARHALAQAHAPAEEVCASTLGAGRFADAYLDLAIALSAAGDFAAAVREYSRALKCRPRNANIIAALAAALFNSRDLAASRRVVEQGLTLDPRSVALNRLAGELDFVAEHWADATARFRYVAASEFDRQHATYAQLMLWLAQRRAGVAHPELVPRTPTEGWPQPLVLYLRGQYTVPELLAPITSEEDDTENYGYGEPDGDPIDERLCEALFYVGETHWANGNTALARAYFTALVNLRVFYFVEHGLALAEIAKLRDR